MIEVSKSGVRIIEDDWPAPVPIAQRGQLNEMVNSLYPVRLPISSGVLRFKGHAGMNRHWDAVADEVARQRQEHIRGFNAKESVSKEEEVDLTEGSRPASLNDLVTLAAEFEKRCLPYLLIGGLAMIAQGLERSTRDIDFLFPLGQQVGDDVAHALLALPRKAAKGLDPSWFLERRPIRVADECVVDLHFEVNGHSYESLLSCRERVELGGVAMWSLSLEGLLKTKRTARAWDIPDRLYLERALQVG